MATAPNEPAQIRNGAVVGAIDPTENVKALTAAGLEEQDKLREAESKRLAEAIAASRLLTDSLREAETRRVNEQNAAESRRVDEQAELREQIASLRAEFYEKLRVAESARVDANRAEDKAAAALAAERLAAQVTALATTAATTAETLRNQVGTSAASQQQQVINPLVERVALLEQTSYKGQGREAVSDPALTTALTALANAQTTTNAKLDKLADAQSQRTGQGLGAAQVLTYIFLAVGALGTIIGIIAYVAKP
jgi:leucyl-tRNA synthetase